MLALNYKKKAEPKNGYKEFPVDDNKDIEHNIRSWILAMFSVLVVATYPVFFLYFQNADEAAFSEVVLPLIVFIATGFVFFVLFLLITKNIFKAAIIANMFMLVFMNYALLESGVQAIFSNLRYWHVLPIFLFILAHLAWFITKKVSKEHAETVTFVICIVFSALILFNGVISVPTIINKISNEKQAKEQINKAAQISKKDTDLPNIYYLIFDEYSSIDFMKKYYDYDNSAFTDYLESIGFNVSYTSHNESIMTSTITTNLVNLDYLVTNKMSNSEKHKKRKSSFLFNYLREKGYSITGVGGVETYGLKNAASEYIDLKTKTVDGKAIVDIIFGRTFIYPLYRIPTYKIAEKRIVSTFQYLKDPNNYISNNFIFCHIDCPHEPFYFNKDGYNYDNPGANWKEQKYYLGQYIYATNNIIDIVKSIVENDPNSCIILQSDHSARASSDPDLFMEVFPLEDMSNILNAVYYKKEKIDIEGLSGVNTLRHVLNVVFGDNFEMLDIPVDDYKYK